MDCSAPPFPHSVEQSGIRASSEHCSLYLALPFLSRGPKIISVHNVLFIAEIRSFFNFYVYSNKAIKFFRE
ncbi:hypothetical protein, partial [Allofournierella massiliensis]|uniref:hypothetical protein n=1 Tax=Allofournierella massiliensis TaxID=1650663 RepID=UPI0025A4346D